MLAVPVSVIEKYLASLRMSLTTGVATNNDPHFDDVKKASSIVVTNCLDETTVDDNDNAGNGCGNLLLCNGLSFCLFLLF